jgi:hypothetical protein
MSASVAVGVGLRADGALELLYNEAATALAHHEAVVAALRSGPIAPLRFGAALDAEGMAHQDQALRHVVTLSIDHVEIGVRCRPSPMVQETTSGRSWLHGAAQRKAAADSLQERLKSIADVVMVRELGADGAIRRFALCVPRAAIVSVVAAVTAAIEGFSAEISGPWPLYSFTPAGGRT